MEVFQIPVYLIFVFFFFFHLWQYPSEAQIFYTCKWKVDVAFSVHLKWATFFYDLSRYKIRCYDE